MASEATLIYQSQVSILGPVGYGPTTLPLRHSDLFFSFTGFLLCLPQFFAFSSMRIQENNKTRKELR
ncbi:hypothetical protein I3843_12G085600 [Carya illinoinensis]|uniref:Uncharacterized protein n=1 Tax=Carya illinoinensis TaxID=32201 RepID=A0A8T1NWG5_CARIL|nr:hypothetical protein I3760_12G083400 [Carya illinoinensis]KAG6633971.1 hypothetical protein CIPAW_12G086000 [Carya illinoinensis]KAG7952950.1 hypothetical protein I3843_12G085600 [Carya illinoinensis]